jgi:GWxTD domain-containing protein
LQRQYPLAVHDLQSRGLQLSSLVLAEAMRDSAGAVAPGSHNLPALLKPGRPRQYLFYEIYGAPRDAHLTVDYAIIGGKGDTLEVWSRKLIATGAALKVAESLAEKLRRRGSQSLHVRVQCGAQAQINKIDFRVQVAEIPETLDELAASSELIYAPLKYISSRQDYQRMVAAQGSARDSLIAAFWRQRDPTPGTARNELQNEFYRRVAQVEAGFGMEGAGPAGWKTARGRIYIIYGPPPEVQVRMREGDERIYEIWFYPESDRRFIFRERDQSGVFELIKR